MAWGGSISDVARNEITLSAQQRAAHERELEMLLRQQEQQRDHAAQTRQLDQRDSAQAQQQRQFDASLSADASREDRLGRYNDANLQIHRDDLRERTAERQSRDDWQRKVFTLNDQDRKLKELMPYAEDMASQGMFGTTEDVIQHFPSLAPQAPAIAARSKAARQALEGQYNADQADANLLNEGPGRATRLNNMITAEKSASWNSDNNHWWRSNQPDDNAVQQWRGELNSVDAARAGVTGDRNRMGRLVPDTSGRYSPAMTLPWRSAGTATSTNAPAAQNIPPAPTDATQRKLGATYQTPRGPLTWTGTGWISQ